MTPHEYKANLSTSLSTTDLLTLLDAAKTVSMPHADGFPMYFIAYVVALSNGVPMPPPIKHEVKLSAMWTRWNNRHVADHFYAKDISKEGVV